jgi:hypothetical protein
VTLWGLIPLKCPKAIRNFAEVEECPDETGARKDREDYYPPHQFATSSSGIAPGGLVPA